MSALPNLHIKPKDFANKVGISTSTLKRWEGNGIIKSIRQANGYRLYRITDLKKALELDCSNYTYLIDGAVAYWNRNWDAKKKNNEAQKKGKSDDGSPKDLSDKEYAKILLEKAVDLFKNDTNKTLKEKELIEDAKKRLEKL